MYGMMELICFFKQDSKYQLQKARSFCFRGHTQQLEISKSDRSFMKNFRSSLKTTGSQSRSLQNRERTVLSFFLFQF